MLKRDSELTNSCVDLDSPHASYAMLSVSGRDSSSKNMCVLEVDSH